MRFWNSFSKSVWSGKPTLCKSVPSWLPKVPLWLRKNALCLSQSAFSNFAPHVISCFITSLFGQMFLGQIGIFFSLVHSRSNSNSQCERKSSVTTLLIRCRRQVLQIQTIIITFHAWSVAYKRSPSDVIELQIFNLFLATLVVSTRNT